MSIRKLTLDEWFLQHQLQSIGKEHFHLPAILELDLSRISDAYKARNEKLPLTAILIKAAGLLLSKHPEINRQIFYTLTGPRFVEFDGNHVNIPVLLEFNGVKYVSATVIKNADVKSPKTIQNEINDFRKTPLTKLPIGKYIVGRPNHLFSRLRLRAIYWFIKRFPSLTLKAGAGGIAVSSLLNLPHQGVTTSFFSRGPNAFTLCACSYAEEKNRLNLALSWDHLTGAGYEGVSAALTLGKILQCPDEADLNALTGGL
jgi:hypothetical protein